MSELIIKSSKLASGPLNGDLPMTSVANTVQLELEVDHLGCTHISPIFSTLLPYITLRHTYGTYGTPFSLFCYVAADAEPLKERERALAWQRGNCCSRSRGAQPLIPIYHCSHCSAACRQAGKP